MKIVVIGGTGLIGTKLAALLTGHEVVPAAPSTGVNTITGEGLADVLKGADVVVDVANSPSFEAGPVMEFFKTSTGNLLQAEDAAGVRHHVGISIVGTERLPDNAYFAAKLAQEALVKASGIPYSLVHATQFMEFVAAIADEGTWDDGKVHIAPVAWAPIAADDVAANLARVATGEPLNARIDIAGPDEYRMDEFFRKALAERGDTREVVTDEHARYFGSELTERSLVPIGEATLGEVHYDEWYAAQGGR
ncbi:SDR family oxidoreductase [Kribbella sindirgiensis]|uniref:SDR family oxidoreductase n=1 Tax=Kribbella sindirgiensis TaxID=1124744 RepID=A0A4R0I9C9_9ACTN|nr:SDR family oxidoreductase [Kribbella sindirgiensis]TCC24002.1 SDR family oxidoreductase [Kribbella sindirgiensis]